MNRVGCELVAVEIACPRCSMLEVITVDLSAVLTTPGNGVSSLRVKAASKPIEHWCSSLQSPAAATLFDESDQM